jgi:hypothetical protein
MINRTDLSLPRRFDLLYLLVDREIMGFWFGKCLDKSSKFSLVSQEGRRNVRYCSCLAA